jgi:DNA polymerase-3 subunit delta
MIIFLHGSDTYSIKAKLNELTENYRKKNSSGFNFKSFEGEKLDYQTFKDEFRQTAMFKEKKLVVLKNVFGNQEFKEAFFKEADKFFDSQDVIIFTEEKEIPTKDSLFKLLSKKAKVQDFPSLKGVRLVNWAQKELANYNLKISSQVLEMLIGYVGSDLWQLSNEIKKIAAYKNKKGEVLAQDIALLVRPKIETDIFKTIDAIAQRNKKQAIALIHKHLEKGDNPLYVLSMITFQFRNILEIKDLMEKGQPLNQTKLHPFVIQKSRQQSQQFTLEELKKIYRKIFRADFDIKTGKLDAETALDLLMIEI